MRAEHDKNIRVQFERLRHLDKSAPILCVRSQVLNKEKKWEDNTEIKISTLSNQVELNRFAESIVFETGMEYNHCPELINIFSKMLKYRRED